MNKLAGLAFAAAMAAGGGAAAQTAETDDNGRTVELELREAGQVVAAPTLQMQFGRTAALAIGNYSLRLRMDRAAAPEGSPAPYVIRSSVYRSAGGWTLIASPAVNVVRGEQARLRFAGQDGSDLSLAVLVR